MRVLSTCAFPRRARHKSFHLGLRPQGRRARVSTGAQGPRRRDAHCSLTPPFPPAPHRSRNRHCCAQQACQVRRSPPHPPPQAQAHQGLGCGRWWRCPPRRRRARATSAHAISKWLECQKSSRWTHHLANLDKCKQATPDALDLSQHDWIPGSIVGGAAAARARHSAVAGVLVAIDVVSLELIDEILPKVLGTVAAHDLLVLVVVARQAPRIGGACIVDLLEGRPQGQLHQDAGVTAVGTLGALSLGVADGDVARVLCARR
jgi:hypothetical protein